ncbi:YqaJ viral recombinase family protein [Actinomadura bangladeshensis]|uniref:Endonuclease n=1 Tax=Actinomadura bangladeshensis TaxID=453573 RepID=A0A6L9QBS8_9ACTN|nr:YqaJ viral recombinase family protein [Actinomadura bangladeshensis]NEA21546.1 endonuclease [Actinomadura bangladeshensis]NEA22506.1 endonuclease [Actinomadura bangladeshensis]
MTAPTLAMPTARLVAPYGIDRDDWLAVRKMGGSDVAAMLGMDKYRTPRQVWLEKRGELPDLPRSPELEEYAEIGSELEDWIAGKFARVTGTQVATIGTLAHVDRDWMTVNLDRVVDGCAEPCLLECKNRSEYLYKDWKDEVPDGPALQAHWGMAVTGLGHAHVAALIGGNKFRHFRIDRNESFLDDLVALAGDFWATVEDPDATAPPIDGSDAATELLAHLWETTADSMTPVDPAVVLPLAARRAHLKDQIGALESDLAAVENQLKDLLGEHEIGHDEQMRPLVTWKQNGVFAAKRFREAEPELAAQYTRPMPCLDVKALAKDHPETYRRYRARVLRIPKGPSQ